MNEGKKFEKMFKNSVPESAYFYRIKDSASGWGDSSNTRFTSKNEFDTMMFVSPILFLLELKSTKGTSISFKGSSPMIKEHQIKELLKASIHNNIVAGFIFNFREPVNETYFLNILNFIAFYRNTNKSSINKNDIIANYGILIESKLMRTRYKYNLEEFIKYHIGMVNNETIKL
jgi:penicillin-binding protein-related factor A (putative recombinase)